MRRERNKVMRNGSGYHDPTAGKAILRADRYKRRTSAKLRGVDLSVGRSSGLSGDTEMILKMCT